MLMLADGRHLGTVGQALLADLIIDTVNAAFDHGLEYFTHEEMLKLDAQYAGTT